MYGNYPGDRHENKRKVRIWSEGNFESEYKTFKKNQIKFFSHRKLKKWNKF